MIDRDDMQAMANEVSDRYGIDSIAIPSKLYKMFDCTDPYVERRDGPYVTLDLSNIENIQCQHDHHRMESGVIDTGDVEISESVHRCSHRCLYPIAREISLWYQSDPFHPPMDDPDCIRNLVDMCCMVDTELSCVQPESDQVLALTCSKEHGEMTVLFDSGVRIPDFNVLSNFPSRINRFDTNRDPVMRVRRKLIKNFL